MNLQRACWSGVESTAAASLVPVGKAGRRVGVNSEQREIFPNKATVSVPVIQHYRDT
jgi:hypothetical protein